MTAERQTLTSNASRLTHVQEDRRKAYVNVRWALAQKSLRGADGQVTAAMFKSFSCLIQWGGPSISESIAAKSEHEQSVLTSQDVGRERSDQLSKGVRLWEKGERRRGVSLILGFIWLSWSGGGWVALWTLCLGGESPRGGRVNVGQGWWSPLIWEAHVLGQKGGRGWIVCRGIREVSPHGNPIARSAQKWSRVWLTSTLKGRYTSKIQIFPLTCSAAHPAVCLLSNMMERDDTQLAKKIHLNSREIRARSHKDNPQFSFYRGWAKIS